MTALQITIYAFTLWMGTYMLERAGQQPGVRAAGAGLVIYALSLGAVLLTHAAGHPVTWQPWFVLITAPVWALALLHLRRLAAELPRTRRIALLGYVAAVFLALLLSLLLVPQTLLSNADVLLLLSIDVVALGYVLAWLTARDSGEALLPDALRSLLATTAGCVLFGGQVVVIAAAQGNTAFITLLSVLASVILIIVFNRRLADWLDSVVYQHAPDVKQSRAALRETADILARSDPATDLLQLDPDEFARLTRRALSQMNRPQRLAANPLMQLPLIDTHPDYHGGGTLDRANTLRAILADSIDKLKPERDAPVAVTDDWRYYNVLFYPYVIGVKPYSTRLPLNELDDDTRAVVEWIRAHVPERTLYNWQNAAARLIAQDLRDQIRQNSR